MVLWSWEHAVPQWTGPFTSSQNAVSRAVLHSTGGDAVMLMTCAYSRVPEARKEWDVWCPDGPAAAPPAVRWKKKKKKGAWVVGCGCRDDKGEGDRIKTRRLVAFDESEERRGCTVVSVTLGLRSGNTHMQPVSPHTHLDLVWGQCIRENALMWSHCFQLSGLILE